MKAHREEFSVERMASVLDVSRSGYYSWLKRGITPVVQNRLKFDVEVATRFKARKKRFGRRRLTIDLHAHGQDCSVNRVARSLHRQGLQSRRSRKFIVTTDSKHPYAVSENLLNREFHVEEPDRVWVSDITYLRSDTGWLYLAVFIDLFSRTIVGWHVSTSLRHESVLIAFRRAVRQRGPVPGLIVHSDRGVQYCCEGFREAMRDHDVRQSMSRKGDCWDNAVAESFFATLKKEFPDGMTFSDLADAERYLFEYIEIDYHRHHPHSTLGYQTPASFEQQYWETVGADQEEVA
jgi:transposase InsO family protein